MKPRPQPQKRMLTGHKCNWQNWYRQIRL